MLNIAVIGAGRIGHVHAKTIATHPGATLALVADPFGDAASKLAEVYGARHTTDVDSVFTDEGVDAVVIGSPTPLHIPHLLAAAKAEEETVDDASGETTDDAADVTEEEEN